MVNVLVFILMVLSGVNGYAASPQESNIHILLSDTSTFEQRVQANLNLKPYYASAATFNQIQSGLNPHSSAWVWIDRSVRILGKNGEISAALPLLEYFERLIHGRPIDGSLLFGAGQGLMNLSKKMARPLDYHRQIAEIIKSELAENPDPKVLKFFNSVEVHKDFSKDVASDLYKSILLFHNDPEVLKATLDYFMRLNRPDAARFLIGLFHSAKFKDNPSLRFSVLAEPIEFMGSDSGGKEVLKDLARNDSLPEIREKALAAWRKEMTNTRLRASLQREDHRRFAADPEGYRKQLREDMLHCEKIMREI